MNDVYGPYVVFSAARDRCQKAMGTMSMSEAVAESVATLDKSDVLRLRDDFRSIANQLEHRALNMQYPTETGK